MNSVNLTGRLTKDPELRYIPETQNAVATFTIAVDRPFSKEKQADFIKCTVFGKQAENCEKFTAKGKLVAVQGYIKTGSYKNKEGATVYTTDVIADRLAAMNPMANIDEKSDVPPEVQMRLAQAQQQLQEMQQQLQAAQLEINNRGQVAQIREEGANKRKLMDVTARAHNTETMAEVKVNDQNTRSITSQNKTEIDALVKMLIARMSPDQLLMEIERLNAEQQAFAAAAAQDISHGANPLVNPPEQQMPQQPMQ